MMTMMMKIMESYCDDDDDDDDDDNDCNDDGAGMDDNGDGLLMTMVMYDALWVTI